MLWVIANRSRDTILLMHRHNLLDRIRPSKLDAAQFIGEALDLFDVHLSGVYNQVLLLVHLLLLCCPSANCFAKGLRVDGCACGAPPNQWDVIVVSRALTIQLLDDVSAAAHESCGLLHQSHFSTLVVDVRLHEESAHVSLRQLH